MILNKSLIIFTNSLGIKIIFWRKWLKTVVIKYIIGYLHRNQLEVGKWKFIVFVLQCIFICFFMSVTLLLSIPNIIILCEHTYKISINHCRRSVTIVIIHQPCRKKFVTHLKDITLTRCIRTTHSRLNTHILYLIIR